MNEFLKVIGVVALLAASIFLGAYVSQQMWNLTISPLGVPQITFWHAFALGISIRAFTSIKSRSFAETRDEPWPDVISGCIGHMVMLLVGLFIVRMIMV